MAAWNAGLRLTKMHQKFCLEVSLKWCWKPVRSVVYGLTVIVWLRIVTFTTVMTKKWRQLWSSAQTKFGPCDCTVQIFLLQNYASLGTKRRFSRRRNYYGRNSDYQCKERHVVPVSKIIVVGMERTLTVTDQSALNRHTVQLFTDSDDTRGCNNTICPPEDEQGTARNMLRIIM